MINLKNISTYTIISAQKFYFTFILKNSLPWKISIENNFPFLVYHSIYSFLMSDEQYKQLQTLFETNQQDAINECKNIILKATSFDSYDELISYYRKNSYSSICQKNLEKNRIGVHCFDCAKCSRSYICLQCFLNGNHQGHHYIITKSSMFKCDCGDCTKMKCECFCKDHQNTNQNDMNDELKKVLTDIIFKAVFSFLFNTKGNESNYTNIFDFIISFLQFGDDFCHLMIDYLANETNFEDVMMNIFEYSLEFNQSLSNLCTYLISYTEFKQLFSNIAYKCVLNHFFNLSIQSHENEAYVKIFNIWHQLMFDFFYEYPIQYCIKEKKYDWVDYFIELCKKNKEILKFSTDTKVKLIENGLTKRIFASVICASQVQPNEQTQLFFDRLFSEVLNCGTEKSSTNDTIIPISFKDDGSKINIEPAHIASVMLNRHLFNCFKFKKNLKFDVLFEELEKNTDISPIYMPNNDNDKFISKYLLNIDNQNFPSYYYESFPKGGSFFFSMPLYDSFITLFGLENNCRIKMSQLLLTEKYQSLRVKLGIITLQKILSFVCIDHPLFQKSNQNLFNKISSYNNTNQITLGLPRYLPVFQLILGLQRNDKNDDFNLKEFFEYEMARKIGIFDDFTNQQNVNPETLADQNNKMTFSFLFLSILIVIDRILFNFDNREFLTQQLLFAVTSGTNDLNELSKYYDSSVLDDDSDPLIFNEIIKEIIKPNDKEMHLICSTNPIMKQYTMLVNKVASNPDNLIDIKQIEPEETSFFKGQLFSSSSLSTRTSYVDGYDKENEPVNPDGLNIRLKELLMTPTVLAIVYHTLRTSGSNTNINDILAMNVLAFISQFVEDKNEQENNYQFDEKVIQYESINDLISIFRKDLFNYQIDDQGNASIDSIMNKKNFDSFLHLKISLKDQEGKSIVELLLEKGQIGIHALQKAGINSVEKNESNDKVETENKAKNNSMKSKKEEILSQFQDARNNFKFDINDEEEEKEEEEHLCSICQSHKEDEILVYPLYVYRTKLPCIFDKPPELKGISDSVSISSDDDIYQNDSVFFNNVLNDHMENSLVSELNSTNINALDIFGIRNVLAKFLILKSKQTKEYFNQQKTIRTEKRKEDLINKVSKRYIAGANYILQYSICPHFLHSGCVDSIDGFKCPSGRKYRNCFLPCLTNLPKLEQPFNLDSFPQRSIDSIKKFIELMKSKIIQSIYQKVDIFIELIKSISGVITTFEVYIRNNAEDKFSDEMKILTRNLFMTTWYAYRIYGKPKMTNKIPYYMENDNIEECDVETRMTIFQRFIKRLIEDDNIEIESERESSFKNILESFIASFQFKTKRDAKELWMFLRRVYLSNYFLLGNSSESPNWSEILSFKSLYQKYNINSDYLNDETIKIKPFKITSLPKEFLHFAKGPYNFPIDDTSRQMYYNVLDYNSLIENYDDLEETENEDNIEKREMIEKQKLIVFSNEIEGNFELYRKNYPVVSIPLTHNSSQFQMFHGSFTFTKPFVYLDENNCTDCNFERKSPLFLKQDILDIIINHLLSIDSFNFRIND